MTLNVIMENDQRKRRRNIQTAGINKRLNLRRQKISEVVYYFFARLTAFSDIIKR